MIEKLLHTDPPTPGPSSGLLLDSSFFPYGMQKFWGGWGAPRISQPPAHGTLQDLERGHITRALEDPNWRLGGPNGAAESLGIARTSLIHRMRKVGIPRRSL
jgi:transcriptional regulator of acetoin/glycerol metabolism